MDTGGSFVCCENQIGAAGKKALAFQREHKGLLVAEKPYFTR